MIRNPFLKRLDFDRKHLPWVDKSGFRAELLKKRHLQEVSDRDAGLLTSWHEHGFLIMPGLIEESLIDGLLSDYEQAWLERPVSRILSQGEGILTLRDSRPRELLTHHHYRLLDFHNVSEAGARIMMHPEITRFFNLVFDDTTVGTQSLLFEYGSEQKAHQDFAYVHAKILSHLAAVWVACEDADETNGPLFYYPGSHKIPKYDFGFRSLKFKGAGDEAEERFRDYLVSQCSQAGLEKTVLKARKGDVFFWHGALVHGGSDVIDSAKTRKSFVSHYSSARAYSRDRRWPDKPPILTHLNGGIYYQARFEGHKEWLYPLAQDYEGETLSTARGQIQ